MRYMTSIFGVIGLLMLVGSGYWYNSTRTFLQEAILAQGEVIDLQVSRSSDSLTYHPVVSFVERDGRVIEFRSSSGSNPPSYDIGEQVDVFYLPSNPQDAMLNGFFSLWGGVVILGLLGSVFSAVGFVPLVVGRRSRKKAAWLKEHGRLVMAEVTEVERRNYSVNDVHPWRIRARWRDERGQWHEFVSDNVWDDPGSYIRDGVVPVYIDPQQPDKRHHVDLSFLPAGLLTL